MATTDPTPTDTITSSGSTAPATASSNKLAQNSTDVPWHTATLTSLSPSTRQILETYSNIPSDEVLPHIHAIRSEAWAVCPYPCIGRFAFTDLSLGEAPQYPEVLERVKKGQRYLDVGCCFGQDIRRLVADGVNSEQLYGTDLEGEFFELGYDLFRDRETLKAKFFPSDIFSAEAGELDELEGSIDIIHAASFFHLFDLEQQKTVARKFIKLLKPTAGSMVLGRHMGDLHAREYDSMRNVADKMYRHDLESWKGLWKGVGEETGTSWRVDVVYLSAPPKAAKKEGDEEDPMAWQPDTARLMRYAVWRE